MQNQWWAPGSLSDRVLHQDRHSTWRVTLRPSAALGILGRSDSPGIWLRILFLAEPGGFAKRMGTWTCRGGRPLSLMPLSMDNMRWTCEISDNLLASTLLPLQTKRDPESVCYMLQSTVITCLIIAIYYNQAYHLCIHCLGVKEARWPVKNYYELRLPNTNRWFSSTCMIVGRRGPVPDQDERLLSSDHQCLPCGLQRAIPRPDLIEVCWAFVIRLTTFFLRGAKTKR